MAIRKLHLLEPVGEGLEREVLHQMVLKLVLNLLEPLFAARNHHAGLALRTVGTGKQVQAQTKSELKSSTSMSSIIFVA